MKDENGKVHRERHDDAFVARWARRFAMAVLLPATTAGAGILWHDRTEKVERLNTLATGFQLLDRRVTQVENSVLEAKSQQQRDADVVLLEVRELRGEVRQMYRRAVEAGGRNP